MLFVSRISDALPPLSLVWRRIRPVLTGFGITTWVFYRSAYCLWNGFHNSPSLWELLVVPWKAAWRFLRQQLLLFLLMLLRGCGIIVSHDGVNPIEDQIKNCVLQQPDDDPNTNLQSTAARNDKFIIVGNNLWNWIQLVVEDILFLAMITTSLRWIYVVTSYCTRSSWKEWQDAIVHWTYTLASEHVPFVQRELQRQGAAFRVAAQQVKQKQRQPDHAILWKLPDQGRSYKSILEELVPSAKVERESSRWYSGKQSGTVYYPPSEDSTQKSTVSAVHSNKNMPHSQFLSTCYALYSEANPLHYGCWPRVQQCEAEVLTMVGDLLHTPPPTCGCLTSGGTESIVLAIRAQAAYFGRYVAHPELIAATTAHAAVRKACELYGIRLVQVHVGHGDNPFQLTPDLVRPFMTANTVMIYASAPCYPQGVVDDIVGLGELAFRHNVGLHVDACLGGFVLPFWRDGVQFDFTASKGVTSMSIDTHKYGMAAKGTSVVLYRHAELRHAQYFSYADWTGGLYATPTLAGSRPGGLSVAAWASLVSLGWNGLQAASDHIREAVEVIVQGINSTDGIKVLGKKQYMVVCFCVDPQNDKDAAQLLDIYTIKDHMSEAFGWNLNDLQNPACVHLCVTLSVAPRAAEFVQNLRDSVAHVRQQSLEQIQMGRPIQKRGMAAIYGTVQSVPAGSVEYLLKCYTDETLAP